MNHKNRNHFPQVPLPVVLLCLALLAFGIGGRGLWTADEPREAEIAREMSVVIRSWISGDTLRGRSAAIPYLAGEPFVEKPPLYYWVSALMMLTAGRLIDPAVAARALSALAGGLTMAVLWLVFRSRWGKKEAAAAALILSVTAGFFVASHWILIDPLLMLLTAAAILFAFQGLDAARPGWLLAGYLAGGLAFLTKGFVAWGLLFPPAAALVFLYYREIIRRPLLHLAGLGLFFGPGLAWAAAFHSGAGEELWREWLINNNLGRFSGDTTKSHLRGPFYYLGIGPLLLLPWTPLLLGGLFRRRSRAVSPGPRKLLVLLLAWAVGGFVLLSLAGTKRDIYLYPLLPGFAGLAVYCLRDVPRWVRGVYGVLTAVLTLPIVFFAFFTVLPGEDGFQVVWRFSLPVLVCALAAIFALRLFRSRLLPRVLAVSSLLCLAGIFAAFPVIDREKDYEPAVRRLAAAAADLPAGRLAGWRLDETTRALFSYYAGLTIPDLADRFLPPVDRERVAAILAGEDADYDAVLFLLKRQNFPPPGMPEVEYRVVAEDRMGMNRRLYLLAGPAGIDDDSDHNSDSDTGVR